MQEIIDALKALKDEYDNNGRVVVDNVEYSYDEMVSEIENGTEIGRKYVQGILKMVITYMSKFKGDDEG